MLRRRASSPERSSSSTAWARQCPRSAPRGQTGTGDQDRRCGERHDNRDRDRKAAGERAQLRERESVGAHGAYPLTLIDLDEGSRCCGLDERDPEQRQDRPDGDDQQSKRSGRLAGRVDAEQAETSEHEGLE